MPTDDYTPVKYVRNSDQTSANGAIGFYDDDRPNLPIGGVGLVTPEERNRLGELGFILEDADVELVPVDVMNSVYGREEEDLKKLTKVQLQDRLDRLGADYTQSDDKSALVDKLEAAQSSADAEGAESLPATVPVGGTGAALATPSGQTGSTGGSATSSGGSGGGAGGSTGGGA